MKIEIKYLDRTSDTTIVEVIESVCQTKEEAELVAINHAQSMGSGYFPFFKIVEA